METLWSVCIGIGLATACGLRVFVPLLTVAIASHFGGLPLSPGFQWLGSTPALIAFSVAAGLEIAGYYLPWIDNVLDTIATPSAILAGTLVSVALMTNLPPFYKWALGIIAGGGMAGLVQGTTVVARGASSAGTGGLGNPLLSTAELTGSIVLSILAIVAPALVVLVVAAALCFIARRFLRRISPLTGG
ncbi:MAG TPA: DUF4126 domain-containing protein [Verrucomicrobiae bacterium]|nr:DUF4126 domain-containing protein [Verrucomicrobiae bacterium]